MFLHFWEVLKKLSKPQIRKKPFEVFYLFKNIILFSLVENRQAGSSYAVSKSVEGEF